MNLKQFNIKKKKKGVDNTAGPTIMSITETPKEDGMYNVVVWSEMGINFLKIPASQIGKSFSRYRVGTLKNILQEKFNLSANLKLVSKDKQSQLTQKLIAFEQQKVIKNFKFGVLFCKQGQKLEEEMFSNGIFIFFYFYFYSIYFFYFFI